MLCLFFGKILRYNGNRTGNLRNTKHTNLVGIEIGYVARQGHI